MIGVHRLTRVYCIIGVHRLTGVHCLALVYILTRWDYLSRVDRWDQVHHLSASLECLSGVRVFFFSFFFFNSEVNMNVLLASIRADPSVRAETFYLIFIISVEFLVTFK